MCTFSIKSRFPRFGGFCCFKSSSPLLIFESLVDLSRCCQDSDHGSESLDDLDLHAQELLPHQKKLLQLNKPNIQDILVMFPGLENLNFDELGVASKLESKMKGVMGNNASKGIAPGTSIVDDISSYKAAKRKIKGQKKRMLAVLTAAIKCSEMAKFRDSDTVPFTAVKTRLLGIWNKWRTKDEDFQHKRKTINKR